MANIIAYKDTVMEVHNVPQDGTAMTTKYLILMAEWEFALKTLFLDLYWLVEIDYVLEVLNVLGYFIAMMSKFGELMANTEIVKDDDDN